MSAFEPLCMATALGSFPLAEAQPACELILEYFDQIPLWPQLPRRSFLENMYVQFSEGLPGVVLQGDSIHIDRNNLDEGLTALYTAYLDDQPTQYPISEAYASGLPALLSLRERLNGVVAIKGHVTGPISLGLQITDLNQRPILYDEILADAAAKLLRLKATWQEVQLSTICPQTIVFVDEPYLSTFGSAYVPISRRQVLTGLEEVFGGIQGLKGLHCCGNTDWAMLLDTSVDIISFDAYHYAVPFSLYAAVIQAFLRRGGIIAWGIVPNDPQLLAEETPDSLVKSLLSAMQLLVDKGISQDTLLRQALVTASCGLGTLKEDAARKACALTSAVSARMQSMLQGEG